MPIIRRKIGDLFNLEIATPAESSYRLAKHDVAQFPDIKFGSRGATPYYTNSSNLPVGYTADIFDALDVQDEACKRSIHRERFSMRSWAEGARLEGRRIPCKEDCRELQTVALLQYRPPIPYARSTAILRARNMNAYLAQKMRFTAA